MKQQKIVALGSQRSPNQGPGESAAPNCQPFNCSSAPPVLTMRLLSISAIGPGSGGKRTQLVELVSRGGGGAEESAGVREDTLLLRGPCYDLT